MHNYIWCPYYLPSFMKFCSVVSEELCWQAASEVYFGKFLIQRGITPTKFRGTTFPGNMHNYIWCPYYLPSFMKFCSVVSEELRWQTVWRTDGQTDRTKTICLPTKVGGDIIICPHMYHLMSILCYHGDHLLTQLHRVPHRYQKKWSSKLTTDQL